MDEKYLELLNLSADLYGDVVEEKIEIRASLDAKAELHLSQDEISKLEKRLKKLTVDGWMVKRIFMQILTLCSE